MNYKLSLLETLTLNRIAVTIKKQYLHLVAFSIDENIEVTVKRIIIKVVFHQCAEAVIALAHIGRCATQPDSQIAFGEKHNAITCQYEVRYLNTAQALQAIEDYQNQGPAH